MLLQDLDIMARRSVTSTAEMSSSRPAISSGISPAPGVKGFLTLSNFRTLAVSRNGHGNPRLRWVMCIRIRAAF